MQQQHILSYRMSASHQQQYRTTTTTTTTRIQQQQQQQQRHDQTTEINAKTIIINLLHYTRVCYFLYRIRTTMSICTE